MSDNEDRRAWWSIEPPTDAEATRMVERGGYFPPVDIAWVGDRRRPPGPDPVVAEDFPSLPWEGPESSPISATMAAIIEFLRARLDEDEAGVRPYVNDGGECRPWRADEVGGTVRVSPVLSGDDGVIARAATHLDAVHIARHDPARVLREIKAKREILDAAEYGLRLSAPVGSEVEQLAAVYSDHPDYRQAWAPV